PISVTKSPQTQVFILNRCCKIATRAGCPNTFANSAIWFCWLVNISVLANPISLSYNCNITINRQTVKLFFRRWKKTALLVFLKRWDCVSAKNQMCCLCGWFSMTHNGSGLCEGED